MIVMKVFKYKKSVCKTRGSSVICFCKFLQCGAKNRIRNLWWKVKGRCRQVFGVAPRFLSFREVTALQGDIIVVGRGPNLVIGLNSVPGGIDEKIIIFINELDHITPKIISDFEFVKARARFHFVNAAETICSVRRYEELGIDGIMVSYCDSFDPSIYRNLNARKIKKVESLGVSPIFGPPDLFRDLSDEFPRNGGLLCVMVANSLFLPKNLWMVGFTFYTPFRGRLFQGVDRTSSAEYSSLVELSEQLRARFEQVKSRISANVFLLGVSD